MSQQKRKIDDAAAALNVPVGELTEWLMRGEYRKMPDHGAVAAPVTATVYRAADDLGIHPRDLARWLDGRAVDKASDRLTGKVWGKVDDGTPGWIDPPPGDVPVIPLVKIDGPAYVTVPEGTTIGVHLPDGGKIDVAKHNVSTHRLDVYTAPELVSEDDYRGVAADLIDRWAADHADATTVLSSLHLAAHGMPVTTPSRRTVDDVRDIVEAWRNGDVELYDALTAIARRTEV